MLRRSLSSLIVVVAFLIHGYVSSEAGEQDPSPRPDEQQLPFAMHSQMDVRPQVVVGQSDADIMGSDNRALQAAVDYVANLGGGTVIIGPGEYIMRDSLHLRSNVTVRGSAGKTILRKAESKMSPLTLDGDFGEQQVTVENAEGFEVGQGIAVWDDGAGGFHTTVARIVGRRENTLAIDKPLMSDCMVSSHAKAATAFPVISGYDLTGARIENLIVDGNKEGNIHLNGCRGGGIFLYRAFGTQIRRCTVRNYNGDGISFQQTNDVVVENCVAEENASLGFHPGSGSQRPIVRNCVARKNGTDGLFLCWRVRHGQFEDNLLVENGRFGISIGHKDSDNLLQRNRIIGNESSGVFFRNESLGMAAHRNHLKENIIEDNGESGVRIRGATHGLTFEGNTIRDTRASHDQTQTVGFLIEHNVRNLTLDGNHIDAKTPIDDQRTTVSKTER